MQAYCFKCKAKKEMKDEQQVTLKNGRKALKASVLIVELLCLKY
jgi:hypothetical protein